MPVINRLFDGCIVARNSFSVADKSRFVSGAFSSDDKNPYHLYFYILILYWINELDRELHRKELAMLADYCIQAEASHWTWYAFFAAELLAAINYQANDSSTCLDILQKHQNSGMVGLSGFLPRIESWKLALDAMQKMNRVSEAVDTTNLRLVWKLTLEDQKHVLYPVEQRRLKNGNWSKGQAVYLERLYKNLEQPDNKLSYLSSRDLQLCSQIRQVKNAIFYDVAGYILDPLWIVSLQEFPLIFWDDRNDQVPVSITRAEPQLLIKSDSSCIHIALLPAFNRESVCVYPTAENGLLVYQIKEEHRELLRILGASGLKVPVEGKQQVLDAIASITSVVTIQSDIGGNTIHAREVPANPYLSVQLQPAGEGLQVEIYARPFTAGGPLFTPGKGGMTVFAEIDGEQLQVIRDLESEKKNLLQVFNSCAELEDNESLKWTLVDPESALETLSQLQELEDFVELEWPKGQKIQLFRQTRLSMMRFGIQKKNNWFELEGSLELDENNVVGMQRLLELLRQSPGRFLKLEEGQVLALTKELRARLTDMLLLGETHKEALRFHPLSAPVLAELTEGMQLDHTPAWKEQLQKLSELDTLEIQLPSTFQGELRDYQREGIEWMLRLAHWGAGACLADDMGLGKTIQALNVLLARAPQGPALILAPTSVCMNWREEAQRFAPTLNVQIFGTGDRQAMLDQLAPFSVIICSYGLLQTEGSRLADVKWHTLVADEAQAIKNMLAKRTKAALEINADFKIITTGTPVENHLGELWSLFNFLNPGLLGSHSQFNRRFAMAIERNAEVQVENSLRKLLRPFILRRLKSDVLTELPSRTEVTLRVELSENERNIYEVLRREAQNNLLSSVEHSPGQRMFQMLLDILKLRQACCHPRLVLPESKMSSAKMEAFELLLDELLENRHKALVFSQFIGCLTLIREVLDKKQVNYHYLDGSTPVAKRQSAINAFQSGAGDVFLISLKAGGVGLNLTAADYVIHMDPWWNPAVEDQASDRAHRMGQTRPVTIYRIVAKDTIEDKIVALHKQKRDLANSILKGTESSGKRSLEDMAALVADFN